MPVPASELRSRYEGMSDAKLLDVLRNPNDYRREAYAIAVEVGTERGLYPLQEENSEEPNPLAKPGFRTIDVEEAPTWMEGLFFLLPFIGVIVNIIWYMALHEDERDPRIAQTVPKIFMGVAVYVLVYYFLW